MWVNSLLLWVKHDLFVISSEMGHCRVPMLLCSSSYTGSPCKLYWRSNLTTAVGHESASKWDTTTYNSIIYRIMVRSVGPVILYRRRVLTFKKETYRLENSYFLHWNFDSKSCFWVFFLKLNEWKNPQFNFSCQNLSLERNFFKWDGKATKIWYLLFHRISKNVVFC